MSSEIMNMNDKQLAEYIWTWMRKRNRFELEDAFGQMTVHASENFRAELAMILEHRGKPPNWIDEEEPEEPVF